MRSEIKGRKENLSKNLSFVTGHELSVHRLNRSYQSRFDLHIKLIHERCSVVEIVRTGLFVFAPRIESVAHHLDI